MLEELQRCVCFTHHQLSYWFLRTANVFRISAVFKALLCLPELQAAISVWLLQHAVCIDNDRDPNESQAAALNAVPKVFLEHLEEKEGVGYCLHALFANRPPSASTKVMSNPKLKNRMMVEKCRFLHFEVSNCSLGWLCSLGVGVLVHADSLLEPVSCFILFFCGTSCWFLKTCVWEGLSLNSTMQPS